MLSQRIFEAVVFSLQLNCVSHVSRRNCEYSKTKNLFVLDIFYESAFQDQTSKLFSSTFTLLFTEMSHVMSLRAIPPVTTLTICRALGLGTLLRFVFSSHMTGSITNPEVSWPVEQMTLDFDAPSKTGNDN